ncbi:MAG: xanthine permease, partial [Actinomycetota bacterium]|nr:xanthine permease [Actinomycetota bacterium]
TYRERYGFPWIVCARDVGDYSKLVDNGWVRMSNSRSVERATALVEISKIANYRFNDLIADANPIASSRGGELPSFPNVSR